MTSRIRTCKLALVPAIVLALGLLAPANAQDQEKAYEGRELQSEEIGTLEGDRTIRMVLLTMQPGAEIPEHQHAGPGLRYVLDGAITVVHGDGEERTYEQGETYFEGAGANHPAGSMSAWTAAEGETRVLIVEVVPTQD